MVALSLWLGTVILLLFAFIVGLHVLRDIFHEGKDRYQSESNRESSEPTGREGHTVHRSLDGTDEAGRPSSPARGTEGTVICNNCKTANDSEYTFCQECTERL